MEKEILVSEIRSFLFFDFGINICGKTIFPLSKIKVYADDGNSITIGLITIRDKKQVSHIETEKI